MKERKINCDAVDEIDRRLMFSFDDYFEFSNENSNSISLVKTIINTLANLNVYSPRRTREIQWFPYFHHSNKDQNELGDIAILITYVTEEQKKIEGVALLEAKMLPSFDLKFDQRCKDQLTRFHTSDLIIKYCFYNLSFKGSGPCFTPSSKSPVKVYPTSFLVGNNCQINEEQFQTLGYTFGEQVVFRYFHGEDLNFSDPDHDPKKTLFESILNKIRERLKREPSFLIVLNNIYNSNFINNVLATYGYSPFLRLKEQTSIKLKYGEIARKSLKLKKNI